VVVVEPDERRRALLTAAPGASPQVSAHEQAPGSVDVAVVAVGDPGAYEAAIAALAPRGRLIVFSGLLPADDAALPVSLSAIHYHEHTFVGAYGCSFRHGVDALDLLASRRLRVDDLISHRLPLAALDEGLDLVARRAGMKIHLYPERGTR
jgi:L-iditol 2-dehydrogenase